MSDKFRLLMNAVDDDLLEEAMTTVKRKRKTNPIFLRGAAIAACLLLVIGSFFMPNSQSTVTASELSAMGYDMKLPEEAKQIRYALITRENQERAQASFVIQNTKYVYQAEKCVAVKQLTGQNTSNNQLLVWNTGALDLQLLASSNSTSVSWYQADDQTQRYLTAKANTQKVLTTASQILKTTGLNVTVAPEHAKNITYNAFLLNQLTVAETTFQIGGTTYAYRMAGTNELLEDFEDISGLEGPFEKIAAGNISWCKAKISLNQDGQGKIIWFDLVPGILYSLTMDKDASKEALLDMANMLFEPAQEYN